jgi:hypothetical protein
MSKGSHDARATLRARGIGGNVQGERASDSAVRGVKGGVNVRVMSERRRVAMVSGTEHEGRGEAQGITQGRAHGNCIWA